MSEAPVNDRTLGPGEVHVWLTRPEQVADPVSRPALERLLSPEELTRRNRFRFDEGRHQFLTARALVRTRLSLYADVPPQRWSFRTNPHGRPEIATPRLDRPLYFNLSHTRGLVACAVARLPQVGIDTEDVNRRGRLTDIARRYFSPQEGRDLRALPEECRRDRFLELWTLKESFIKAKGVGIGLGLARFSFHLDGGSIGVSFDPSLEERPESWQFLLDRPDPTHVLALSLNHGDGSDLEIVIRECPSLLD